jgi:dihydrofolate reductase
MGRLIVSMNLSLDGCIEAQGQDDGSWLRIDEEVHRAFNELAAGADAFLYGRKVYEVMIPYWPDAAEDAAKPAYEREYGQLWVKKPKLIISTSLNETRWNTRVLSAGALEEVARLKRESKDYVLCYGGAQLVSTLQERGLVDEYALFIHPSALGAGVPFFRGRVALELLDVRRFGQGALGLRYSSPVT